MDCIACLHWGEREKEFFPVIHLKSWRRGLGVLAAWDIRMEAAEAAAGQARASVSRADPSWPGAVGPFCGRRVVGPVEGGG